MNFLYTLSLPVLVTISVVGAVGLSLGGLALFHSMVDKDKLRESHDVAGFVYAVVGVIYAVLLAFVVIVVWEQFRNAEDIAENEAMHLGNVRQLAKAFPDSVSKAISTEVENYAQSVITREWPAMANGHSDGPTYQITKKLWNSFYEFHPSPVEQPYYNESLRELTSFNDARRLRIIGIDGTMPTIMWTLLIGGGFICIAFTYLFATPHKLTQYLITGLLAAMIAVTLFLIAEMNHPYKGGMSLQPNGFEFVLHGPAALKE
jgi:hypothetical protein